MTPYQQLKMLQSDDDDPADTVVEFDTWEEYRRWQTTASP